MGLFWTNIYHVLWRKRLYCGSKELSRSREVSVFKNQGLNMYEVWYFSSSETQGQIVGASESLNGRKNMARRKVKNGGKSPWGQCVFLPNQKAERRRPFGSGLVKHCLQGLFSPFFTFLRAIFFRQFRFSLAPTICPWVSEDVFFCAQVIS